MVIQVNTSRQLLQNLLHFIFILHKNPASNRLLWSLCVLKERGRFSTTANMCVPSFSPSKKDIGDVEKSPELYCICPRYLIRSLRDDRY